MPNTLDTEKTYTISIIDIRANLAQFPLLGRRLWVDLCIRSDEPVSRAHKVTIIIGDLEFGRFHIRKLYMANETQPTTIELNTQGDTYGDKGQQVLIRFGDNVAEEKKKQNPQKHHI